MNKKEKNYRIWLCILLILFFAPLLTYLICFVISRMNIENKLIFQIGTVDTWITFAGSIIGGCITLFALYFTIYREQTIRKENEMLKIKPLIIGEISNNMLDETLKMLSLNNAINSYGQLKWKLVNITDNVAKDVKILKEQIKYYDSNTQNFRNMESYMEDSMISIFTPIIREKEIIKPKGEIEYITNVGITKTNEMFSFQVFMFKHIIIYEYCDLIDMKYYKNVFEYTININIDNKNNPCFFLEDTGNYPYEIENV